MNQIAVATYFDGTQGLFHAENILRLCRAGYEVITRWAFSRSIKDINLVNMDGTFVTWILKGELKS